MRADAERNYKRILKSARELVRERGVDVSMDEIAAAAGIAVGTIYRHHPTKAALLEAVIADSLEEWAAHAAESVGQLENGADPGETVDALIRTIAVVYAADRRLKSAAAALGARVSDTAGPFPPDSVELRVFASVETVLAAARDAGAVRLDFGPADLALIISGVPDGEAQARRYADLVLHGIRKTLPASG